MKEQQIQSILFGLAVGDALGVPVEFASREFLLKNPVKMMIGFRSHNQPPGTWSDDSSLAFCLAQSLIKGYEVDDIAKNFIQWYRKGYWGAHYKVFDIGGATKFAIERLLKGTPALLSGGLLENDNGNGSLMRIMPLIFNIHQLSIDQRYQRIKEVSAITHAHFRSVFACFIYIEIAILILHGRSLDEAYFEMQRNVNEYAKANDFDAAALQFFARILKGNIKDQGENNISSGGYVIHTLEASLWCLMHTQNYADAVLKAVNLGEDTDTTACVTGGLAGLLYGYDSISNSWIDALARKDDINNLCSELFLSEKNKNSTDEN